MAEMTPMQRFVYAMAKDYHTDDDVKDPSDVKRGQQATRGF